MRNCTVLNKRLIRMFICTAVIFVLFASPLLAAAASVQTELVNVPVITDSAVYQLEAKIYKPQGAGPFPLIVLTHGTPRTAEDRIKTNAEFFRKQAQYFADMGFAVIFVVRRGFGKSQAPYAENPRFANGVRNYTKAGLEAAADLKAAVEFMKEQPYIDGKRIILMGQSTGGHSAVAAGSLQIEGVIGVVNFAGGRGSYGPDKVRNEDSLIGSMAYYGKTSFIPTLWLYSENDHYFSPSLAQTMVNAYTENGGQAKFIRLPPFGEDGHRSFVGNTNGWVSHVNSFLSEIVAP